MKRFLGSWNLYKNSKMLMLDLDGTVYRGNVLLENIDMLNNILREKTVIFLTNSGTKTAEDVKRKLISLGLADILHFNCYTALQHLINVLEKKKSDHTIYYISNRDILETLGCDKCFFNTLTTVKAFEIVKSQQCSSTIVAFFVDTIETLDLDELVTSASIILSNGGAIYFSAGDTSVPTFRHGCYVSHPGPGSIIAMLKSMSSKHSNIYALGKGNDASFMEKALEIGKTSLFETSQITHCEWNDVVVVGDNPMTDIAGGLQMGASTVLVGTGMKTEQDTLYYNRPHLLTDTLGNFVVCKQPFTIGVQYFIDIFARKALNLHKFVNEVTNTSLTYCLHGISSAPIKKTQSLPCKLETLSKCF